MPSTNPTLDLAPALLIVPDLRPSKEALFNALTKYRARGSTIGLTEPIVCPSN